LGIVKVEAWSDGRGARDESAVAAALYVRLLDTIDTGMHI